ncbi:type I restriction enzyme, S subunit [Bacteroidales bacterium KHT7]|nr:type I restriction enzyme, S subunit [Bacteroidales bacterium KHT7]
MSEWKKVKLGEIAAYIQTGPFGSQLHQSDYSEIGTPVVMPKDIVDGRINVATIARVGKQHVERLSRHKITEGDILYARRGDVGKCAYTNSSQTGWLCGTGCLRVTIDKEKAMPKFIFFQLQKKDTIGWVEKHAVGATMLNLNTSILSDVPIELPPISTQHRIASILSRYDSLIDNYQKQIKLLEEAAQRLYKEWFVDLHFPGHENTKIVDGVPEGWVHSMLGQLVEFKRGKTITKKEAIEGTIPVVAGGLEPAYYCNRSNTAERVITVSGSGANAGFTRMYFEKIWASDCSFVDSSTSPYLHYVYCFLKNNKTTIDNMQKGAAQPHVYAKDINLMEMCIPAESVLKSFEKKASKYYDTISSLQSQIRLLTEARDRLLPKLMSGEFELK